MRHKSLPAAAASRKCGPCLASPEARLTRRRAAQQAAAPTGLGDYPYFSAFAGRRCEIRKDFTPVTALVRYDAPRACRSGPRRDGHRRPGTVMDLEPDSKAYVA